MIHLHPFEQRAYRALKRLVFIYRSHQPLSQRHLEYFYFLGGEHSLCRETVSELLREAIPDGLPA